MRRLQTKHKRLPIKTFIYRTVVRDIVGLEKNGYAIAPDAASQRQPQPSAKRGFTFTVSAILIALTLVSMAFFASQWRKSQEVSYNEVLPSDSVRLQDRIASDFRTLSGVSADVQRTGTSSAAIKISFSLPLKKEGADVVDMSQYSSALASSLRGTGVEAAIYGNISGNSPTVVLFPDAGAFSLQNDMGGDLATYVHPAGWKASALNATLYCAKRAISVGEILVQNNAGTAVPYQVVFKEQDGRTYTKTATAYTTSTMEMNVTFEDGSQATVRTVLSPSSNTTTVNYTKSPGAYFILPLDANASTLAGDVRDYSGHQNNFTLGGGTAGYAPAWSLSCKAGGCYVFDGSNDLINGTLSNLTQSGGVPGTQNFGFETYYNASG